MPSVGQLNRHRVGVPLPLTSTHTELTPFSLRSFASLTPNSRRTHSRRAVLGFEVEQRLVALVDVTTEPALHVLPLLGQAQERQGLPNGGGAGQLLPVWAGVEDDCVRDVDVGTAVHVLGLCFEVPVGEIHMLFARETLVAVHHAGEPNC